MGQAEGVYRPRLDSTLSLQYQYIPKNDPSSSFACLLRVGVAQSSEVPDRVQIARESRDSGKDLVHIEPILHENISSLKIHPLWKDILYRRKYSI